MTLIILQAIIALLIGTVCFDVVHYLLHRFITAKNKMLRAIGHLHAEKIIGKSRRKCHPIKICR